MHDVSADVFPTLRALVAQASFWDLCVITTAFCITYCLVRFAAETVCKAILAAIDFIEERFF